MPSIPLIALKPHFYAGKTLVRNKPFEALSENDAIVLKYIGVAKDVEPEPAPEPVPEPAPSFDSQEQETDPEAPRKRRPYRRRDLTVEE